MNWSFYRMKLRDRVICLLLFVLFWLVAICCESADAAIAFSRESISFSPREFTAGSDRCLPALR